MTGPECNCGHDHGDGTVPPYDVDKALKEMARARVRRDPLSHAQAQIGDKLATYLTDHFSPEELETAGRAALIGAAGIGALAADQLPASVLVNVLGFAGARLIQDGRAWEPAQEEVTR